MENSSSYLSVLFVDRSLSISSSRSDKLISLVNENEDKLVMTGWSFILHQRLRWERNKGYKCRVWTHQMLQRRALLCSVILIWIKLGIKFWHHHWSTMTLSKQRICPSWRKRETVTNNSANIIMVIDQKFILLKHLFKLNISNAIHSNLPLLLLLYCRLICCSIYDGACLISVEFDQ